MTGQTTPSTAPSSPGAGRLAGRVVIITGTGGGQGRAAALRFAAEGAIVVGADLKPDGAQETVRLVREAGGTMTSRHPIDLTDETEVAAWVAEVVQEHGRIDVLYANAAATRFGPIEQVTLDEWAFVLRNELDLVFLVTREAWPHLKESPHAAVVLVGSTAGVTGSMANPRSAHTVTKGGIIALTRQLAAEGAAHGIRVNCVSPGLILTPATMSDLLSPTHGLHDVHRHIPLGRVGQPAEVASCAVFLASDDASYVTGANLMVDGGWSAVLPGAEPA